MAQETAQEGTAHRQLRGLDEAGLLADGGLRAEIIGGELVLRGAPRWRHQEIVTWLGARLLDWAEAHGVMWPWVRSASSSTPTTRCAPT